MYIHVYAAKNLTKYVHVVCTLKRLFPPLSLSLSLTFVTPKRHFFAKLEEVLLGMNRS